MTKSQRITVVLLMAGTFLIILNQTLLSPVLPVLMSDFSVDAQTVQWLTSGYSLVMAVIIPLSPYLLGRFGSKKLFIASQAFFVVGSAVAGMAPAFAVILIGRIFQAIAAGIVMPMAFTIVLLEFPREKRGSAMGIVMLVVGFAPAIGPTLAGILVDTVGWRMLFIMVSALMLLTLLCALKWLKSRDDFDPTTFDVFSVILSSIGLVALLYGLSSITKSETPLIPLILIVFGIALLIIFCLRQLKLKVPLLRIDVLKVGRYRSSVIAIMIDSSITTGMSVLLPLFIQNLLGNTAFTTGLVMLPGAVTGAIVGLLAGKLFDKRGIRVCAVPGVICMTLALVLMAIFFGIGTPLALVAFLYGLMFVGLQLINTTVGTWGLNALDNGVIQHAQATSNTMNQVAASLLTAIVISVTALGSAAGASSPELALETGYHFGFIAIAIVVAINFIVVMLFVRDAKPKQSDKSIHIAGDYQAKNIDIDRDRITVAMVMNRHPYAINESQKLQDLVRMLVDHKTSGVAVIDSSNKVTGFVSDGDIMKYLANSDQDLLDASLTLYRFTDPETFPERVGALFDMKVSSIMTRAVIAVEEDLSIDQACQILSGNRIKKVPVVDDSGSLVGTLSRSDIVRMTLSDMVQKLNC